jgi:hypothetical protein
MLRKMIVVAALAMSAAAAGSAQAPQMTDKPGAEQKNLAYFEGAWSMEGKMHASPFGPGGTITATETCKMFEGGWHLVCDSSGTGPMGPMKGHTLMTYDRLTKQYRYFAINNMPDSEMAVGGKSGNTWTWTNTMTIEGKTIQSRFILTEASPTSYTGKWEMSMDGTTWNPVFEAKATKKSP